MTTIEVFGVSNEPIKSYIERPDVDTRFLSALHTRKHIVIFGSSKQGKTALVNRHMHDNDFVRINCSPSSSITDIHQALLRQLNVEFEESNIRASQLSGSIDGSFQAKVKIPLFASGTASATTGMTANRSNTRNFRRIGYNLALPQDISEILKKVKFNRRIILENFHYLKEEIQSQMAFNLRVFEDSNILFIILGIWREKNRLAQYNGDLQDRMTEIPVEPWQKSDFKKVSNIGSKLLNVDFNSIFSDIVNDSFDSIGVFQELCKESCIAAGVSETSKNAVQLTTEHLKTAVQKKLEDYTGRHIKSIETFVEQKHKVAEKKPLYIPYYFIKFLLASDFNDIEKGLSRTQVHSGIKETHHRPADVRPSDMNYFLHNLTAVQIKKNIIPPLFDYDRSTRRLKIIDSTLYFFLRNADLKSLLDDLRGPD